MRKLVGTLIATGLLIGAPGTASSAAATTPSNETIVLQRDANLNEIGWSASGLFADSGSWTSGRFNGGGGPKTAGITLFTTETGSAGSFSMLFHGRFREDGSFSGTWEIGSGGTGAYANLSGQGDWSRSTDPVTGVNTYTCVGQVRFE